MKKKGQSIQPSKTNHKRSHSFGMKVCIGMLIFLLSTSSGFAVVLPVYDVLNHEAQFQIAGMQEKNRAQEFIGTMQQWATQFKNWKTTYDQTKAAWDQVDQMRGNWKGAFERLADQQFVKAVIGEQGRDLVRLGWELKNTNRTNVEVLPDQALDALDRIEKVMTNKKSTGNSQQNGDPTLRDDLEEVYGQVPGTRPDIENAHRTLARATSTIADINKAIEERRANIEQWKGRIAAGGLVPGDLERLQIMISAEQQDIQLLSTRLGTLNIEVQMAHTGLLAAEESDREISRSRAEAQAAEFKSGAGLLTPTTTDSTQNNR